MNNFKYMLESMIDFAVISCEKRVELPSSPGSELDLLGDKEAPDRLGIFKYIKLSGLQKKEEKKRSGSVSFICFPIWLISQYRSQYHIW